MMTLLAKAKSYYPEKGRKSLKISDQHIDLGVAYLQGEVRGFQVKHVLGRSYYAPILNSIIEAHKQGRIKVLAK